jgi:hypothetical protein
MSELYKFRGESPSTSRLFTRDEAIEYTVRNWGKKYGTTAKDAADELDGDYSQDFERATSSRSPKKSGSPLSSVPELYKFRGKSPSASRIFTRDEAIAYTVREWGEKYGTTAELAADELDGGYSHDFERLTPSQYMKLSSKKTGPPPRKSPTRKAKRCPRGTRRNKKSGSCESKK